MQKKGLAMWPFLVWFIAAFFYLYKYVIEVSPSVMVDPLMRTYHLTGATVGYLAASYFYAYLIMQLPFGVLSDRYGPRRVVTVSVLLCSLGLFIFSQAQHYDVALLGRFVCGLGAAAAGICALKIITLYFPVRQFAVMAGLLITMGMIGALFGQVPLFILIHHFSIQFSMLFLAIVGGIIAVVLYVIVRDKPLYSLQTSSESVPHVWYSLKRVLTCRQTWILSIYSGFVFAPISIVGGLWGVPFFQLSAHLSNTSAAEVVSMVFVGLAMGSPLIGYLSERSGVRLPWMRGLLVMAFVSMACMIFIPHLVVWQLNLGLFIFGFSLSAFLLGFSMVREVNLLLFAATAMGFMNCFDSLLSAIADPLLGKLLDWGWHGKVINGVRIFDLPTYQVAMSIILVFMLLGFILLFWVKETYCQQRTD